MFSERWVGLLFIAIDEVELSNLKSSLTELLSPYTTITPAPPKYQCLDTENKFWDSAELA